MAIFYRVVKTNPPTERDFLSYKALGRPLSADTPELRRSWEGVSVRSTFASTQNLVRRFPRTGSFVAQLSIEDGSAVRVEKTGNDPTHYDLYGEPRDMLAAVIAVRPV